MTWNAVPVGLRTLDAGYVAVHIIPRAAELTGEPAGWRTMTRRSAHAMAIVCENRGRASRKRPMPPGARIALQGLARQIRHRLNHGAKS